MGNSMKLKANDVKLKYLFDLLLITMTLFCRYWLIAAVFVILNASNLQAQELKVAVASNFYHSLHQLIKQSEFANKVVLSSGSTGLLLRAF